VVNGVIEVVAVVVVVVVSVVLGATVLVQPAAASNARMAHSLEM
jgi:hypothetical protein